MWLLLLAVVLLVLVACGFHFQSNLQIPSSLQVIKVESKDQDFLRLVQASLKAKDVIVMGKADFILDIISVVVKSNRATYSSGDVSDVQLTVKLTWVVKTANQQLLFPPKLLQAKKTGRYSLNEQTSSLNKVDQLVSEIYQSLAKMLVTELTYITEEQIQSLKYKSLQTSYLQLKGIYENQ